MVSQISCQSEMAKLRQFEMFFRGSRLMSVTVSTDVPGQVYQGRGVLKASPTSLRWKKSGIEMNYLFILRVRSRFN
jgi:hypothetical protein